MLSSFDAILAELAEGRKELEDLITEDPYLDRILKVFDGKVGPKPTNEELNLNPKINQAARWLATRS